MTATRRPSWGDTAAVARPPAAEAEDYPLPDRARPPGPTPGGGSGSGNGRPGAPPAGPVGTSLAAEIALVCVTAAAALGLARLFAGWSFAGPVLVAVVGSHAVAWMCRRQGLGLLASAGASLAGLVLAVTWLVEPQTTRWLLPTWETWRAALDDLSIAWERFGEVKAPTQALPGFVLAAVAGAWAAAATSDFFAFRMRARFEAMAPAFTLFVFGSILGAGGWRVPATGAYLAALLAFVLLSETSRQSRAAAWFAGRSREGDRALLRRGAVLGTMAVAVGVLVGPHLPGVGSAGLVNLGDGGDGGARSRTTVSPLVDIRGRLVDQRDDEMFTVAAASAHYWRLTSLERFDGTIWSSLGTYQPARGSLPGAGPGRSVTQQYTIASLGTIWLPAAYRPARVTGVAGPRFDRDSGSLLADGAAADNAVYEVISTVPDLTAAQLAGASSDIPSSVRDDYLGLPDNFPPSVAREAERVTGGTANPYEKARRLQDFFRETGGFTYSLDVEPGHGAQAIERFLFDTRSGYCEQFAGTFAAMARAVGLPARVAVGFVPGTRLPDGSFLVAGRDAHAWPEVYLGGFGWVAFEPTPGPGRNAPGTEAYTGIGETPAGPQESGTATTTTTPTTVAGGPADVPEDEQEVDAESGAAPEGNEGTSGLRRLALALALALAAYAVGIPAARRAVRAGRRRRASGPSEQVMAAWQEAEESLALAGHPRRASETPPEFARRSAPVVRDAGARLARLAEETTVAGFSVRGPDEGSVSEARAAAVAVSTELRSQAGVLRRARWELDPRPLVKALRKTIKDRQSPQRHVGD